MHRRFVVPGAIAAVALSTVVGLPAHAAARGAECQIAGGAAISPGLTTAAKTQSITLQNVKVTGCREGSLATPGVPKVITGSVTTSPNPVSTKASCASGSFTVSATVAWSTGKSTTVNVTTHADGANDALNGKVTSSTDPNLKPGDLVAGDVVFRPTTTAQNCVKPVTAVTFTGAIALGAPN